MSHNSYSTLKHIHSASSPRSFPYMGHPNTGLTQSQNRNSNSADNLYQDNKTSQRSQELAPAGASFGPPRACRGNTESWKQKITTPARGLFSRQINYHLAAWRSHTEASLPFILEKKKAFDLRNYHLKDTESLTVIYCAFKAGGKKASLSGNYHSPRTSGSHIFLVNSTEIIVTHLLRRGHLCSAWHKHAVCGGV